MKALKEVPIDVEREAVLRRHIEDIGRVHRAALDAEIAPHLKELAEIASTRPIMVTTESGYTCIYRPATPAGERRR